MCRPYSYSFQALNPTYLSPKTSRMVLIFALTNPAYSRMLQSIRMFVMAITAIFDILAYAKRLKAAGFTEDQAEIQTQALAEIIEERLATKQDLKELELRLKHDLTLRLGGMLVAGIAIVAILVKLL